VTLALTATDEVPFCAAVMYPAAVLEAQVVAEVQTSAVFHPGVYAEPGEIVSNVALWWVETITLRAFAVLDWVDENEYADGASAPEHPPEGAAGIVHP
jgi:hypothetical protein